MLRVKSKVILWGVARTLLGRTQNTLVGVLRTLYWAYLEHYWGVLRTLLGGRTQDNIGGVFKNNIEGTIEGVHRTFLGAYPGHY